MKMFLNKIRSSIIDIFNFSYRASTAKKPKDGTGNLYFYLIFLKKYSEHYTCFPKKNIGQLNSYSQAKLNMNL